MKEKEDINSPIEVFSGDIFEVSAVKHLLENENIEAFVQDEIMGTFLPWYAAGGGAGAIRVFVRHSDYNRAIDIIAAMDTTEQ